MIAIEFGKDCQKGNCFGQIVKKGTVLALGQLEGCRLAECWVLSNLEDVLQPVEIILSS